MFFSDSPSDLLPEDYTGKPYRINSSSVIYGDGRIIRETEIDRAEYCQYLRTCKEIPTTAMGTPEQWREGFEEAYNNGYTHAIILVISSTASSVAQSVNIAIEIFYADHPDGMVFEIIDTRTYSMIYGRLLLQAFELNEQGKSFADIIAYLKDGIQRSQAVLGVYSLQCMKKSGRISGMSAFMGEALGIRPVLYARNGYIVPIDKVRGDKNLLPKIVEYIKKYIVNPEEQEIYVLHGSISAEELDRTERLLIDGLHPKAVKRHTLGCTVLTNSGPDTIAISFFGEPFDLNQPAEKPN